VTDTPTVTPTFTETPTPTLAKPLGDVNDDGEVDSIDALLVIQYDADLLDVLLNERSADVNENGHINSVDGALILQFVAAILDELPPPTFP
jgi:hypothetical protein